MNAQTRTLRTLNDIPHTHLIMTMGLKVLPQFGKENLKMQMVQIL